MSHFQDKKPSWGLLDMQEQTLAGAGGRAWVYPTRREACAVISLYGEVERYKPIKLVVKYESYRSSGNE